MSDKYFVDSNIWLYAFMDSSSVKRNQAIQIIDAAGIMLSTQVVNEVCSNLLRKASYTEPEIQFGRVGRRFCPPFASCIVPRGQTIKQFAHPTTTTLQIIRLTAFIILSIEWFRDGISPHGMLPN